MGKCFGVWGEVSSECGEVKKCWGRCEEVLGEVWLRCRKVWKEVWGRCQVSVKKRWRRCGKCWG